MSAYTPIPIYPPSFVWFCHRGDSSSEPFPLARRDRSLPEVPVPNTTDHHPCHELKILYHTAGFQSSDFIKAKRVTRDSCNRTKHVKQGNRQLYEDRDSSIQPRELSHSRCANDESIWIKSMRGFRTRLPLCIFPKAPNRCGTLGKTITSSIAMLEEAQYHR